MNCDRNGDAAMRRFSALACVMLGFALTAPSCAKFDYFKRSEPQPTLAQGPGVGTLAPEIDGEDLDGVRFKLSDYRGKVVVVSFWASWCKPCRNMIPHERALVERFGDKAVVLGVNIDDDRGAARSAITSQRITWRNWSMAGWDNPANKRWGVNSIPTVYVIDASGVIRYANVPGPHLEAAVITLLAEAEKKRQG
jgi:thiol-disulfide isomerase/thioredoxin